LSKLNKQDVYTKLFKYAPDAVLFTVVRGFTTPKQRQKEVEPNLPSALTDLFEPQYSSFPENVLSQLVSDTFNWLKITQEEADFLEASTTKQSSSQLWFDYRKGLITASHFHEVIHHRPTAYPTSIVKSIMQYDPPHSSIPSLKWGRENESVAVQEYLSVTEDKHANFMYSSSGLVISILHPFLGASADGRISCECCGDGIIEVKCPFKYRYDSPSSAAALNDKQYFLKANESNQTVLSTSHKYYSQVQAQLAICDVTYCDFICWTTQGMFIERIFKDPLYLADNLTILTDFFKQYFLPETLTQKLRNSLFSTSSFSQPVLPSSSTPLSSSTLHVDPSSFQSPHLPSTPTSSIES
jgi:hypothetical protein